MKRRTLPILVVFLALAACGTSGSEQVPVSELPDPAIYALETAELPKVGMSWQISYNQTTTYENYKWSYRAYQAYQPGNLGVEMETAFAVNNDIALYEVDMRRADLPQPPPALGNIQNISWKSASLNRPLGDKSAVWKTTLGELLTPVWWLEFYQGHAYVRISVLGFPDPIAPSYLYDLGDSVSKRIPRSVERLRSDAATVAATPPAPTSTPAPQVTANIDTSTATPGPQAIYPTSSLPGQSPGLPVLGYTAPPGETGMVSFLDDTAGQPGQSSGQLTDGIVGSDDILADLGSGTAYEWVGWTEQTDPVTLTFTVDGAVSISSVQIGFNHREGLGIFVPSSVMINGISFTLSADAIPNNRRADLTFTGPFQGPVVEVTLYHRGRGWILVDEVKLIPAQ